MKKNIAALALCLGLAACVENNASITIYGLCAPGSCTFSGVCDAYTLQPPTLDLNRSTTDQLWMFAEVHNQLPNNADESSGRTNTNDAFIEEYTVEYEGARLPGVTGKIQKTVPSNGTSVVSVFPIPPATGRALTTLITVPQNQTQAELNIVAKLRVRGTYGNGSSFESAAMRIPVRACKGCVTDGQVCADPAATCPPEGNGQLPLSCGL